jgi:perosamine synthetase
MAPALLSTATLKSIARRVFTSCGLEPRDIKARITSAPIIHGGPQVRRLSWPKSHIVGPEEKRAAIRVLTREEKHGGALIYGGPEEAAYCKSFADYLGGGYAQAVNSGTNAVYVALRSLDLDPGGEIIVPPITDPGGCMPVPLINCLPIPADSARNSYNVGPEQIQAALSDSTSAIIIAHIGGQPVDMDPILEIARSRDIPVIEDCAQAHGATYKGRLVGTLGDVAAFSTMYGKHHATGAQGGVVFTKNRVIYARVRQIADRGKPFGMTGNVRNVVASLNFNQDEISMAIGRVQLTGLPKTIAKRRRIVHLVANATCNLNNLKVVTDEPNTESSYWFMLIRLDLDQLSCDTHQFAKAMNAEGIEGVCAGYPFFPTDQPWYTDQVINGTSGEPWTTHASVENCAVRFSLVNARAVDTCHLRIPIHSFLREQEAHDIAAALHKLSNFFGR